SCERDEPILGCNPCLRQVSVLRRELQSMELGDLPVRHREEVRREALHTVGVRRRLLQVRHASFVISADRIGLLSEYGRAAERIDALPQVVEETCRMDEREDSREYTHAQEDPLHPVLLPGPRSRSSAGVRAVATEFVSEAASAAALPQTVTPRQHQA